MEDHCPDANYTINNKRLVQVLIEHASDSRSEKQVERNFQGIDKKISTWNVLSLQC
jgi:hypothetical protein